MVKLADNCTKSRLGAMRDDAEEVGKKKPLFTLFNSILIIAGVRVAADLRLKCLCQGRS